MLLFYVHNISIHWFHLSNSCEFNPSYLINSIFLYFHTSLTKFWTLLAPVSSTYTLYKIVLTAYPSLFIVPMYTLSSISFCFCIIRALTFFGRLPPESTKAFYKISVWDIYYIEEIFIGFCCLLLFFFFINYSLALDAVSDRSPLTANLLSIYGLIARLYIVLNCGFS